MFGIEFVALGQQLGENRGGRHGERAAQYQRPLPRQAQQQAHAHHDQHRDDYLGRAEPEHRTAHGAQLGQAEFKADAEHQKHHADFAQIAHLLCVAHPSKRVRTDDHANNQIAQ